MFDQCHRTHYWLLHLLSNVAWFWMILNDYVSVWKILNVARGFPGLLCSPLHAAALHCDTAVLTALIEAKADINAKAEVPAVPGFSHSWTLNICMTYVSMLIMLCDVKATSSISTQHSDASDIWTKWRHQQWRVRRTLLTVCRIVMPYTWLDCKMHWDV